MFGICLLGDVLEMCGICLGRAWDVWNAFGILVCLGYVVDMRGRWPKYVASMFGLCFGHVRTMVKEISKIFCGYMTDM